MLFDSFSRMDICVFPHKKSKQMSQVSIELSILDAIAAGMVVCLHLRSVVNVQKSKIRPGSLEYLRRQMWTHLKNSKIALRKFPAREVQNLDHCVQSFTRSSHINATDIIKAIKIGWALKDCIIRRWKPSKRLYVIFTPLTAITSTVSILSRNLHTRLNETF